MASRNVNENQTCKGYRTLNEMELEYLGEKYANSVKIVCTVILIPAIATICALRLYLFLF